VAERHVAVLGDEPIDRGGGPRGHELPAAKLRREEVRPALAASTEHSLLVQPGHSNAPNIPPDVVANYDLLRVARWGAPRSAVG
jgi:hypothetical protein